MALAQGLVRGDDGVVRCFWAGSDPLYTRYHDEEWGFPVADDRRLFEKICLEGFQAGLSWLTILKKRKSFRAACRGFDFAAVARFGARDVARLLKDAGIVRHRGKIESTILLQRRRAGEGDKRGLRTHSARSRAGVISRRAVLEGPGAPAQGEAERTAEEEPRANTARVGARRPSGSDITVRRPEGGAVRLKGSRRAGPAPRRRPYHQPPGLQEPRVPSKPPSGDPRCPT